MTNEKKPVKSSYQVAEEAIDAAKHGVPWEEDPERNPWRQQRQEEEERKKREEYEEHKKKLEREHQEQMDALIRIACG